MELALALAPVSLPVPLPVQLQTKNETKCCNMATVVSQPREGRSEEEVKRRWAVNTRLLVLSLVLFRGVAPSAHCKHKRLFVAINDWGGVKRRAGSGPVAEQTHCDTGTVTLEEKSVGFQGFLDSLSHRVNHGAQLCWDAAALAWSGNDSTVSFTSNVCTIMAINEVETDVVSYNSRVNIHFVLVAPYWLVKELCSAIVLAL